MVIHDPASRLLALVRAGGDPAPAEAEPGAQREAHLIRRRFGLSLPPPFVRVEPDAPVRVAVAADGPAIAAVKWRAFGTSYRGGILADDFLDHRGVVPPPGYWIGRATLPPTPRHRLLAWGRPGSVLGYCDVGPVHADDAHPERPDAGEIHELYVDPAAQGSGGGARLLAEAQDWLRSRGCAWAELNTITTNRRAQAFYEAHGWVATGRVTRVDLGVVVYDECRYARPLGEGRP